MNNVNDFLKELQDYSLEELELIYETQKDLYSEEEMQLVKERIEEINQQEKERIEKLLPKEILCEKCDGPNPFENDTCAYCGAKINKAKYYSAEYYDNPEEIIEKEESGNTFRYVISFLIPLIGYILGAILLSKDNEEEKSAGQSCIILGIVSTVIGIIAWAIYVNSIFWSDII